MAHSHKYRWCVFACMERDGGRHGSRHDFCRRRGPTGRRRVRISGPAQGPPVACRVGRPGQVSGVEPGLSADGGALGAERLRFVGARIEDDRDVRGEADEPGIPGTIFARIPEQGCALRSRPDLPALGSSIGGDCADWRGALFSRSRIVAAIATLSRLRGEDGLPMAIVDAVDPCGCNVVAAIGCN